MSQTEFDKNGLDQVGIHWSQHLAMTLISIQIFILALDKASPDFHNFILHCLIRLQCSGLNCNEAIG
ncbi:MULTISPECIES: hypothetical protein [Prochlorococcus]|uniref:Uncharacterized protein n=1 Tax=Prochlorococcus marinus (strain SARG / CCMP1375 / SS120) TaxID=167539 RepID=Q7VCP6_PROMA|nr:MULTISPECIES: hypothetical protein [Prochlorococcus]AAP99738.1 Predicted protein [Prochlorococcus marinus subsp. marinus str. CCMP1375]KGG14445.1 hypothetical protein EV04_0022 [Prochlorococcus marinus str. LG]KGG22565.1 hypothetical protein EV08_0080 [Prochlorococcus marinus str. SS2]KGG24408.1 hypothetical protein EV09_0315 [Prochlorococcus marinus str. SS35]KGG34181.1 hypothetical protein EV10_0027 [Prochlorococcus marinus str. SS51]